MKKNKCQEIVQKTKKYLAPCQMLSYFPLAVESAHGAKIIDADGKEYIDFLSSAAALNLGSSFSPVIQAIRDQLEKLTVYATPYTYSEKTAEYAKELASIFPGGGPAKVAFGHSGSDANDAAIKFSRAFTGRQKILVFQNGYHGTTFGAATMSTCSVHMHEKMGPFLPDVYVFPFFGVDVDDQTCERESTLEIEKAFSTYLSPEEVAAIIIEPIQGDAGAIAAHPIFLQKLYTLCKNHGILFIVEEVQQGFWRTGKWFSIEHYGINPDGICMGKALGGGMPMGAFMARAEIMDSLPAPAHTFTLAGNAICCQAGLAAFDYYQTQEFQETLKRNIRLLREEAGKLKEKYPDLVCFVRQMGMTMGIGIGKRGETGEIIPDSQGTFKILFRAYEKGLVVISLAGNVLRIQPPLNIEEDLIRKGFSILDQSIRDYLDGNIPDEVMEYCAGW